MENRNFVLKGDICYSVSPKVLESRKNGFLVCIDGKSAGVFDRLPDIYSSLPVTDYSGKLIIPGLVDLHMHAPQYSYRALGMNLELLDWLNIHTFPEENRYEDPEYAKCAYTALIRDLKKGPNTRIVFFATVHVPAAILLMDMLEESGLVSFVGKVNMDRNCPDYLREENADASLAATREWLAQCVSRYRNTKPILTPRFIPSCSDDLMRGLAAIQKEYGIPVQSHLSENRKEVAWVKELCPASKNYAGAYKDFDLLGGAVPTIMAHCVWSDSDEIKMLADRKVFAAHCPQSNTNLSSGIAPMRKILDAGVPAGLGSDVAGGVHSSIFRAMTDAIQVSKLRQALIAPGEKALTIEEAFWLGTAGGGAFFGSPNSDLNSVLCPAGFGPCGSFKSGYELDALIIDDSKFSGPRPFTVQERLERIMYLSGDSSITAKYVRGNPIPLLPE
jgi:guanine deaminase